PEVYCTSDAASVIHTPTRLGARTSRPLARERQAVADRQQHHVDTLVRMNQAVEGAHSLCRLGVVFLISNGPTPERIVDKDQATVAGQRETALIIGGEIFLIGIDEAEV